MPSALGRLAHADVDGLMSPSRRRKRTDRAILALLALFTVFNLSLDLWWDSFRTITAQLGSDE